MAQKELSEKVLQIRRRLLKEAEAGEYLGGISSKTMASWRTRGGGPKFIRISSNPKSIRADVRYDVADLDAWLDERRFASTSEAAA
jgi:hypothetical protein